MALHRLAALVSPLVYPAYPDAAYLSGADSGPATPAAAPSGDQLLKPEQLERSSLRSRCTRTRCCAGA